MGFGGIGIWQLLIVLAIIVLLFGTKKLKNIGGDLGGAIKGFKKAVSDEDKKAEAESINHQEKQESTSSDVQAKEKDKA
ncbi:MULTISPECIES: Sec-independent protein translocase subunit TatA [unclassified Pseudoalteromonas]|uniref:Sec-independent protein translocase subunit TatA n=1 Tax=unclassified Pseudoalteromonas TaxID=194690 RepID=UPI0005AA658E|nr:MULTISPECIES: Sec-independent protein translocase subunit TatA [unclassified Pseudoalteromonas]